MILTNAACFASKECSKLIYSQIGGVFTPPFQEKVPMVSTPSPSRTLTTTSIMTSKYLLAKDIIKLASMQAMIVDNFYGKFRHFFKTEWSSYNISQTGHGLHKYKWINVLHIYWLIDSIHLNGSLIKMKVISMSMVIIYRWGKIYLNQTLAWVWDCNIIVIIIWLVMTLTIN